MVKPDKELHKTLVTDYHFLPENQTPKDFSPLVLEVLPSGILMEFQSQKVLVGRHTKADFRLPSPQVSRHHCLFLFKERQWYVCDLGSKNGTLLNGVKVEVATIKETSMLEIGEFRFRVKSASCFPLGELVQNLRMAG